MRNKFIQLLRSVLFNPKILMFKFMCEILLMNINRWFAFYLLTWTTAKTQKHETQSVYHGKFGLFLSVVGYSFVDIFFPAIFKVSFKSRDWRDLNKIQDGESHWIFSVVCHPTTVFDVYLKHDLKCNCINLSDSMYINSIYR